jgi:hypothetical protein
MPAKLICFLITIFQFVNISGVFAQYKAVHEIDSVMDLSPNYLPTQSAYINTIEFEPFQFCSVDTDMIHTHQFDPLLKPEKIYQNLGICGQAHQSLIYDYQKEMGFLYQTLPYPLFFKKQSDLLFYKLKTTYARVAYTLSIPKNHEINATFARNMNGATVVANVYGTFNDGTFVHQTTRNLCGDILLHYEIPSSIYGFRASYIVNNLSNEENGGLLDMNIYNKNSYENKAFGVRSTNAKSDITSHDLVIQNYVNIINKKKKYFGTFTYNFQWVQTTKRYYDKFDTIYPYYSCYKSEHETNDSTRFITLKDAIQWSNFSPFQEMSNKNIFFHVATGIMHDYTNIKYLNSKFNSLSLFARTHIRLFTFLDITGLFSYSFNDSTHSDIRAKAGISWCFNREKEHKVGVTANYFRSEPEYILQHVLVNNFRWTNQFKKEDVVQVEAFWNYKNYNISVSYYHLKNLVYLSEQLMPVQNKNKGDMVQVSAYIPFRYKNFGTTANINFQYCTKDVLHIPLFAGKLSVFYIFELFKKRLKIQVGADVMYNTAYYADAYLPVLHKFYNQNSQLVGNFLYFDANLNLKIERICFFFRAGNLLAPAIKGKNLSTLNYPADYLLSLGISWRFYD